MGKTQKEREVLQLLRDYQTYWAAFGGAMSLEDQGVAEANYGPAGIITSGAEFGMADEPVNLTRLAESYQFLEYALTYLKGDGPEGMTAYILLLVSYLGDPSIVDEWRRKRPELADWHDLGIRKLAGYLARKDLYTVPTKLLSEGEERRMEDQNRISTNESFRTSHSHSEFRTEAWMRNNLAALPHGNGAHVVNYSQIGHANADHTVNYAPSADVYTKDAVYTKVEANSQFAAALNTYSKTQSDTRFAPSPHGNAHHSPNFVPA